MKLPIDTIANLFSLINRLHEMSAYAECKLNATESFIAQPAAIAIFKTCYKPGIEVVLQLHFVC